ncbi:hypothetical protein ACFPER_02120 [Agromyces aurantiacus]|uniref:BatC protein n=1 Tax=Agromyces aurantiacus TaxID=165814 RepID=A0ABV9R0F2_9MICO|nr:hypothetical protein [Agromyces aurantiacus]MBM7505883.1 hypothetical protein [Agromyces aurantiacus]
MTDSSATGGTPSPDEAAISTEADAGGERAGESGQAGRTEQTPGAPGNDEPMTDSVAGGLEGGDPGVEE